MNKWTMLMCVLASMTAGATTWTEDTALAQWRLAVATNGYAAVGRKVKVSQEVQLAIWKSYRENIGYEGVQMSKPRLVSTNEFGAVYDLPFTTADGAKHDLCLCKNGDIQSPLAWVAVGYEQKKNAAETDVEAFVLEEILGGDVGKSKVYSPMRPLRDPETSLKSAFRNCEYDSPFDEYWLFFVDDDPMANWMHNARLVLVRDDLSEFAVRYVQAPVAVSINGEIVKLRQTLTGENPSPASNGRKARPTLSTSPKTEFPLATGGDGSKCHCLIVSGGCDVYNNHVRYWNDVCFAYNTMVKRFGIPRANVKVLWASGNPGKDLCYKGSAWCHNNCNQYVSLYPDTELSDFDRDGNNDVNGAATRSNLEAAFAQYASSLQATDQLFVFVTDHGGYYPETAGSAGKDRQATICLWGDESVSDVELASMTASIKSPVVFAIETCYGGGFKEELRQSSKNRIVITADDYDPSAAGNLSMDVWAYNFFSALCGYYPHGTYSTQLQGAAEIDVRHVGEACRSDYDGDGKVSFYEAAQFAYNNNPIASDAPQYEESTANLGKKLFMTQYADAPAVVVKEKVLTPALNPSSGALGYAPVTVTASCGTSGATIRYTLDGSEPNARSTVYSDGIALTGDATVSIRAFKSGMEASDVVSVAYTVKKSSPEKALITSVSQGDSSSGIVVCWSGGSGTESYDLLRSESSSMSSTTTIASGLAASTTSYADLTAGPGKTYYYQIRSRNKYGTTLSAASQGAYLMLNPPDGVTATVTSTKVSSATVRVDWNAAAGASYYRVYRKTSDGTLAALGSWQSSRTYADTVPLSGAITKVSYYVVSSAYSSGSNPSSYSREAIVNIESSTDGWSLILCTPWWSTEDVGDVLVQPGHEEEFSCRLMYADKTFEESGFVNSPVWSVKKGTGISLTSKNGSYSTFMSMSSYRAPTVTIQVAANAPNQIATVTATVTLSGISMSQDFKVIVSSSQIVKKLSIWSPDFAVPGETLQLYAQGNMYGESSWVYDDLGEDDEVQWTIIGGGGATLSEDGELTAWNVSRRTNVVVQARVETALGLVTATKELIISPAAIEQKTVELPPLGGSYTNYLGVLNKTTYGEFTGEYWLAGLCWNSSSSPDPRDINGTISIGGGKNIIGIYGHLFLSFNAARNPGKDRETTFKLRWDGGGIDFRIFQKEAPYAGGPKVSGGADGTITATAQTDGSVLHYATDGEEPTESSPVLSNSISFNDSTEFAVKAFGDWMQASDTVYADVVGKDSQWDEVEISFDTVQSGLTPPAKRTYKAYETFGELPSYTKKNGLYFKGWTLHEGSDKLVSPTDNVPSVDATLYAVWSPVEEDKPSWVALPWNFKSAMTATMKVYDDTTGTYLDPSVCIIGIEDADGVCRGSSENGFGDMQSELNGKNGLYVFGIYSQIESGQETGLRIRIWNRQKGFMTPQTDTISFEAASSLGSESSPYVIHVASGYKVVFNASGGAVEESERMVPEGATVGELPEPTRPRHVFKGWYTAAEGGTKVTAATKVSADVTYYAHWEYNDSAMVTVKVADGCEAMGTVSGGGKAVRAGTKVSLKATANKGYAFSRWEKAGNGEQGTGNGSELLSQAASFTYVATGEPVTIEAVFASAKDDAASLTVAVTNAMTAADGACTLDLGSSVVSLSEPKLAVKGLPAGLKFDAKTGLVSGKATKPGVYEVTVTATNASATGKDAAVCEFTLTVPNLTDGEIPVADGYGPFVPGVEYAETVSAAAGCTVTGLPTGMKWAAKDVVDAKTKAVKIPANSFYGAATKPGSYTVYFTKTVGKAKRTATATFTVGPFPRLSVEMSGNTGKDKATGAGDYAANKKVTLKATPDKGKVFAGWYDAAGEPLAGAADYRTASFPYVTTETNVTLTAVFATEKEDAASLKVNLAGDSTASDGTYALDLGPCVESVSIPKLAVKGLPAGLKYDAKTLTIGGKATKPGVYAVKVEATNASVKKATESSTGGFTLTVPNFESGKMPGLKYATDAYGVLSAGVALNPALIDCTPADGWAVKVAGLPTGLKYDAKTGVISGIPTAKAGSYTVTFTVTKGKEKETATITLNVAALPAWAVGTFDGVVERGTGNGERGTGEVAGLVSLTIDAKGKISGKILEGGQTWTLSAASFSAVEGPASDVEDLVLRATVVGKAGKAVVTNEIAVAAADGVGVVASESWTAIQNLWKRADTKAAQPVFKKNIDHTLGNGLKLTFKKDGAVAFAGKVGGVNVSGSSQLVWVESGHAGRVTLPDGWSVTLYAPPKGTFDGFCETYAVTLTFENADSNVVTSVDVEPVDE